MGHIYCNKAMGVRANTTLRATLLVPLPTILIFPDSFIAHFYSNCALIALASLMPDSKTALKERSKFLVSWYFYGNCNVERLTLFLFSFFFPEQHYVCCTVCYQQPLIGQDTHITTCMLSPLTHFRSGARGAHWGPWGRETKIIIGSSLLLTADCTSHTCSILW